MVAQSAVEDEQWLQSNSCERMDATSDLFDEKRRAFHLDRYGFASKIVVGLNVADIACGTGYGTEHLKRVGNAKSVVGLDIDADAIDYASRRHGVSGVRFMASKAEHTPLASHQLDAIVSFETIEHVEDDSKLLEEFVRLLTPSGILICSTPNQWPLEVAPHHLRVYDYSSFTQLLSEYFGDVVVYNQNSGSDWEYNRRQPAGIIKSSIENRSLAECFIAVAKAPKCR